MLSVYIESALGFAIIDIFNYSIVTLKFSVRFSLNTWCSYSLNPINTGGGGVFSTLIHFSAPELHNGKCHNPETWVTFHIYVLGVFGMYKLEIDVSLLSW